VGVVRERAEKGKKVNRKANSYLEGSCLVLEKGVRDQEGKKKSGPRRRRFTTATIPRKIARNSGSQPGLEGGKGMCN